MPSISILVDEAPIDPQLGSSLLSVQVSQALNAPAMLLLLFADPGEAAAELGIGTPVAAVAPDGTTLIEAEVTAIEHRAGPGQARTLLIRGYDRLHRLRKRQRVRAIEAGGLQDLIVAAAADIGVGADPDTGATDSRLVIQHEQNELDLLVASAAAAGRYLQLAGGVLRAMRLDGDGQDAIPLSFGDTLLEASVELNAETMRRSSLVRGWDLQSNRVMEKAVTLAAQDGIEFRGLGIDCFADAGDRLLVNRLSRNEADAEALAQADMDRATQLGATLTATAEGNAQLRPGRTVDIRGIGLPGDGSFVLTSVIHSFEAATGYVSRLSTALPETSSARGLTVATLGQVTDSADPEKRGRVRARLPAFGTVESGWMPVLVAGAGTDKGMAVFPEPDDEVLVLLPDGDPAHGIVLGSLYGSRTPPSQGDSRAFTLRSPAGQQITFDGDEARLALETAAGDILEMSPRGSRLSVTRDLVIEAPGRSIKIRAGRVDFERA